jgi:pyridoxamine 5'-phosphate oxidase
MNLYDEALREFKALLAGAAQTELAEPTAMTLATADAEGRPSARTVLLKGVDDRGFVFYTNTLSRKGEQLAANARAALCFFWEPLKKQVAVEGVVERVTDEEADAYWATRPRDSQVGAWASQQSQPLESRERLLSRAATLAERYAGRDVPRPPHWSGYRVLPERIEFWTAGDARLHHRVCYERRDGRWTRKLLNP